MSAPDLLTQPATALRQKLLTREIGAADLLQQTIERAESLHGTLNAVIHKDIPAAEAAARESDARIAAGSARPLEGLPITVKDSFDVAGMIGAVGVPAMKDYRASEDASAVARLRAAGAVIYGKSNVPTFTTDFQAYNPVYGTTNNPWDTKRSPGGSSGGAAVAVATGMSAFELASDLGGSVRWPAHCCGLYGLKTTWNLVSLYGHVPPPRNKRLARNPDLMVAGPIARSAADLALVLDAIAGPRDPQTIAAPPAPSRWSSPNGLRVALWVDEPFAPAEASVKDAVRRAARKLAEAGAIIDETARPALSFAEAWEVFALLNHAVVGYGLPEKIRARIAADARTYARGDLSHRALQARGVRITPGDYNEIDRRHRHLRRKWARFFESWDVILCPPAPVVAITHDHAPDVHARRLSIDGVEKPYFDLMIWASLASGGDLPAAVAPVMRGADGLPRGVQIIAGAGQDHGAVAVAGMLETLGCRYEKPPS